MKFIDLFAGLGGFHLALKKLGHKCIFACEINDSLAILYEKNFNIEVDRDIRKIDLSKIRKHDILCAGFPCQPFSKAGLQRGLNDEKNGTLFNIIVKILEKHQPTYFILENVPFIRKHDNKKTWEFMVSKLEGELGYDVDHRIYSPHEFGIPQYRKRIFIVGSRDGLAHFKWPKPRHIAKLEVSKVLSSNNVKNIRKLDQDQLRCLEVWQEFINTIPRTEKIPNFPIWSMEFDATYPYIRKTPHKTLSRNLKRYLGSFGIPLRGLLRREQMETLPSYARTEQSRFPEWKQRFIRLNRTFFKNHRKILTPIINKIRQFKVPSWQKFEWNCGDEDRMINKHIIQFRASGVRVKKTNYFPSLVCTPTQIPIIGWEARYITKREGARLQSICGIKLPKSNRACFCALGNAVNVKIVKLITKALINES